MNTSTTRTYEQQWCCEFTDYAAQLPGEQFKAVLPGDTSMSDIKIIEILQTHGIDYMKTTPAEALAQLVTAIPVDNKPLDMIIPVGLQNIQDALRRGFKPGEVAFIAARPSPNPLPKTNVMLSNMQRLLVDGKITQEQMNQYLEQEINYRYNVDTEATLSTEEWAKRIKELGIDPDLLVEKE